MSAIAWLGLSFKPRESYNQLNAVLIPTAIEVATTFVAVILIFMSIITAPPAAGVLALGVAPAGNSQIRVNALVHSLCR